MEFKNSTLWEARFLRRMLSWVCREIGFPVRKIRGIKFGNKGIKSYQGWASYSYKIKVSIGPNCQFPLTADNRPGMNGIIIQDRLEALIYLTAHEVAHLAQYKSGRIAQLKQCRKTEYDARWNGKKTLLKFRESRHDLFTQWSSINTRSDEDRKPLILTLIQRNEQKYRKLLETWEKKLKIAKTKVKKYQSKVRRYERIAANKEPNHG